LQESWRRGARGLQIWSRSLHCPACRCGASRKERALQAELCGAGGLKLFYIDKEIASLTKVYSHIQRYNHYPWWNVEFEKWSDAKKDDSFDKERMDDRKLLLSELEQLKSEEWIKAKNS
jgi:hypothetical protein